MYQIDNAEGKTISYEEFSLDQVETGLPLRMCQTQHPTERVKIISREVINDW